jgi:hypothetical protein
LEKNAVIITGTDADFGRPRFPELGIPDDVDQNQDRDQDQNI